MSEPVPSVDEIVALPAGTCKYLLIKLLHPEIKDAEAGRLAGYKGKAGGNLKARVAGVLGPYLEAEGLTLESIATVLQEAMNATKIKEVVVNWNPSGSLPERISPLGTRRRLAGDGGATAPDWRLRGAG